MSKYATENALSQRVQWGGQHRQRGNTQQAGEGGGGLSEGYYQQTAVLGLTSVGRMRGGEQTGGAHKNTHGMSSHNHHQRCPRAQCVCLSVLPRRCLLRRVRSGRPPASASRPKHRSFEACVVSLATGPIWASACLSVETKASPLRGLCWCCGALKVPACRGSSPVAPRGSSARYPTTRRRHRGDCVCAAEKRPPRVHSTPGVCMQDVRARARAAGKDRRPPARRSKASARRLTGRGTQ